MGSNPGRAIPKLARLDIARFQTGCCRDFRIRICAVGILCGPFRKFSLVTHGFLFC